MPQLLKRHIFQGSLQSCQSFNLPHEVLTASELKMKSPGFCLPSDFKAVFQPQGGFLIPETCIETSLNQAKKAGAVVKEEVKVESLEKTPKGFGSSQVLGKSLAKQAVLTAGMEWPVERRTSRAPPTGEASDGLVSNGPSTREAPSIPVTFPFLTWVWVKTIFTGFPQSKKAALKSESGNI